MRLMAGETIVIKNLKMKGVLAVFDGMRMTTYAGIFGGLVGAMGLMAGGATELPVNRFCTCRG